MVTLYDKKLFIAICEQFTRLKLNIKDDGKKESVKVCWSKAMQSQFDFNKQFGTVQYMKDHVELRFYINGLIAAGLLDIIDQYKDGRFFKQNGKEPYFHYNSISINKLSMMFNELLEKLKEQLGVLFEELPKTVEELPRVSICKKI